MSDVRLWNTNEGICSKDRGLDGAILIEQVIGRACAWVNVDWVL
jgi:hypothetical protein